MTVIFDDSMDKYLVRQLVAERINQVGSRIPAGLQDRASDVVVRDGLGLPQNVAVSALAMPREEILPHNKNCLLKNPGIGAFYDDDPFACTFYHVMTLLSRQRFYLFPV